MENITEVQLYGPVKVEADGVNLGHTDETGVKCKISSAVVEAKAGKYGDSPIKKWLNGQRIEVEFMLIQSNFALLVKALPGATLTTDASQNQKLTFGKIAGSALAGILLKLTPYLSGQTPLFDLTIAQAAAVGEFNVDFTGDKFNGFLCKFEGLIDEAGGTDGKYLFTLGDTAITQDLTAPVVSSVVPNDGVSGVAVTSDVVWTISKDLDGNTVLPANVKLYADPTGVGPTGLEVSGSIALVNNGASTTITFTPDANLAATTKYIAVLQGVRDKAGNLLAAGFYATEFTTV